MFIHPHRWQNDYAKIRNGSPLPKLVVVLIWSYSAGECLGPSQMNLVCYHLKYIWRVTSHSHWVRRFEVIYFCSFFATREYVLKSGMTCQNACGCTRTNMCHDRRHEASYWVSLGSRVSIPAEYWRIPQGIASLFLVKIWHLRCLAI